MKSKSNLNGVDCPGRQEKENVVDRFTVDVGRGRIIGKSHPCPCADLLVHRRSNAKQLLRLHHSISHFGHCLAVVSWGPLRSIVFCVQGGRGQVLPSS